MATRHISGKIMDIFDVIISALTSKELKIQQQKMSGRRGVVVVVVLNHGRSKWVDRVDNVLEPRESRRPQTK